MTTDPQSELPELNESDVELLSAYIDNMLSAASQARVEQRLRDDDTFQDQHRALEQTVSLVRELPELDAPRDFTIQAEDVVARRQSNHRATDASATTNNTRSTPDNVTPMPGRPGVLWLQAAAALAVVLVGGMLALSLLNTGEAGDGTSMNVAQAPTPTLTAAASMESADAASAAMAESAPVEETTGAAAGGQAEEIIQQRAPVTPVEEVAEDAAPAEADTMAGASRMAAPAESTDEITANEDMSADTAMQNQAAPAPTNGAAASSLSTLDDDVPAEIETMGGAAPDAETTTDADAAQAAEIVEAPETNLRAVVVQVVNLALPVLYLVFTLLAAL